MGQYVGIDLHRRSTTIVRMAEDGEVLGTERFVSQPFELAQAMAAAGPEPEVVLESTYGWYWAADVLQDLGAHVHLAHALGNNWGNRRVKNDVRDAQDLAAMLALGRLAEGWIAPPRSESSASWCATAIRSSGTGPQGPGSRGHGQERDPARRRRDVGTDRSGPARPPRAPRGLRHAHRLAAPPARRLRREHRELDPHIHAQLNDDPGYQAVMTSRGGPVFAAIFVAEIGDVGRFDSPKKLCSLGRAHPQAPRVRRGRPPRRHHQDGMWAPEVYWAFPCSIWR